jgi:hypothetical protein
MQIKHQFTSPKTDGTDATLVQPSNWNADHNLVVTGPALVGKGSTGAGSATEITLGTGLSFNGNVLNATATGNGSAITIQDEGISITAGATSINFTGASVTATANGTAVTVDVSGSSSSGATNLSSTATASNVVVASDTGLDATIASATGTTAGVMSAADKTKLDGLATVATSGSYADLTNKPTLGSAASTSSSAYATAAQGILADSAVQPAGLTKTAVGLGNVDNTSDANKPISTAVATALAGKTSPADVTAAIQAVVGAAPAALDTLNEIASALGNDANYAATMTANLATKAPLASPTFTGTVSGVTASMVGLGNVNNTSDANKPVSTATQFALDSKAPTANPTFTGTVSGVTASMVGLGNVNNTSDANKPVSTAVQTALNAKAPLASPTFTGTVSGVTASMVGLGNVDNTSDINKPISTAVQTALNAKAGSALATTSTAGLMSAADKFAVNNMPSPQFLWDVVGARTPIIAHAGDSISYMTSFALGDNFLLQSLSREYPARIQYGEHSIQTYVGSLSCVVTGNNAVFTYDKGASSAAFFETNLMVGKYIIMPSSGVGGGWDGIFTKILSLDIANGKFTCNANIQYLPLQGPPSTFTTVSSVTLQITEDTNKYVLAKGGHTSTQIKVGQISQIQEWTVPPDIMIMNGGTNDGTYLTSSQNIIDVCEAALTAGVKIVALMPMSPKDGMISNPNAMAQFISAKNIIATYARNRDGIYLLDASGALLDPTSTSYQPIGGSAGGLTATMVDGLHPSVRGAEVSAKYFTDLLKRVATPRFPKALSAADVWDATNNKAGNYLGTRGLFLQNGTAGTMNGTVTSGVATGWAVNTSTVNATTLANQAPVASITTCDYVAPNYPAQRFDFTGLKTGQWGGVLAMSISDWTSSFTANSPKIDAELVVRVNCPGINSVKLVVSASGDTGIGDSVDLGNGNVQKYCQAITPGTGWQHLYLKRPLQSNPTCQSWNFYIIVSAAGNYDTMSGYIEFAHMGVFALHTS